MRKEIIFLLLIALLQISCGKEVSTDEKAAVIDAVTGREAIPFALLPNQTFSWTVEQRGLMRLAQYVQTESTTIDELSIAYQDHSNSLLSFECLYTREESNKSSGKLVFNSCWNEDHLLDFIPLEPIPISRGSSFVFEGIDATNSSVSTTLYLNFEAL